MRILDDLKPLLKHIYTITSLIMNEQKIYELLSSGNYDKENEGMRMLIQDKAYLMQKHGRQMQHYFNDEKKHEIFIESIQTLLEKIRADKFEWRGKNSLEKYLYTLIDGKIKNEIRKIKMKRLVEITKAHENEIATTDKPSPDKKWEKLSQFIREKLGETCEKVLIMRYYEGMQLEEIAKEVGWTHGTTKNNSAGCMSKLKQLIKDNPNLKDYLRGLLQED